MTHAFLATTPRALIIDYGGVVVSTAKRPTGMAELAGVVAATLGRAGVDVPVDRIERSLSAGYAALKDYNNMSSRRREPRELTHHEIVTDFLASDLSDRARLVLGADAARLCRAKVELLSTHVVRPGVRELLTDARAQGVRTAIASNAQSGDAHRAFIAANGLTGLFDVQLYSDEIGVRKPHPAMLHAAAEVLDVPIEACWYVGDTRDRDLLAGRRAGVGAVVLIRHHTTDSPAYAVEGEPDAVFDEVTDLVKAIASAGPAIDGTGAGSVRSSAGTVRSSPTAASIAAPTSAVTASDRAATVGSLGRPRALLLDNGGVLSLSEKNPDGVRAFAADLGVYLRRAGHDVGSDEQIFAELAAGHKRYGTWKNEHDDGATVREITPAEFWDTMVAPHWPAGAKAAVLADARELIYTYVRARASRHLRPGMIDVLEYARIAGIPVGIVSNTICGRVPRENQIAWGVEPYLGVSFFSDEFGFRKPDPSIVTACASALGVDVAECWFVGDKRGRDVQAARRAGVGTAVLIESRQTAASAGPEPDVSVPGALGLLTALLAAR